ncbi:hypothetical protein [Faecalimicrobium dakarense]|uniref:hypothetical protein n=1 Tax=Faecalimicrobium dakarense TaxID=1301100 RepID=UPI0005A60A5E|nr:hypothetical protein [[Clostridium] dakarense]
MDRIWDILLIIAMGICMFSFDVFIKSNQLVFVILSSFGILLSSFMLIVNNKKYLTKSKE